MPVYFEFPKMLMQKFQEVMYRKVKRYEAGVQCCRTWVRTWTRIQTWGYDSDLNISDLDSDLTPLESGLGNLGQVLYKSTT
jgi:hypothetical protein